MFTVDRKALDQGSNHASSILGTLFLTATLAIGGCDESKSDTTTPDASPQTTTIQPSAPARAISKDDERVVIEVNDENGLAKMKKFTLTMQREMEVVHTCKQLAETLGMIAESDKTSRGVINSGLSAHYIAVLSKQRDEFHKAHELMVSGRETSTDERIKKLIDFCKEEEDAISVVQNSLATGQLESSWGSRSTENLNHSKGGINADNLKNNFTDFSDGMQAGIDELCGLNGHKPKIVFALGENVRQTASSNGWFSASAISGGLSLVSIGGKQFSIVSIDPTGLDFGSINLSIFNLSPGASNLGSTLVPVASDDAAVLAAGTEGVEIVAGADVVEGVGGPLLELLKDLLEGI